MHRILRTLFWGIVVLAFAWFVANLPGRISIDTGPYTLETSTSLAVTALLLLFIVLYLVVRLVLLIVFIPRAGSLWRGGRRRRAGDLAVTRALVALAAGEKADARREAGRARSLLGDTPQTLLLAAEAGRLSGRDDEATAAFRALAVRKELRFSACEDCWPTPSPSRSGRRRRRLRDRPRQPIPAPPGCGRSAPNSPFAPVTGRKPWRWPDRLRPMALAELRQWRRWRPVRHRLRPTQIEPTGWRVRR